MSADEWIAADDRGLAAASKPLQDKDTHFTVAAEVITQIAPGIECAICRATLETKYVEDEWVYKDALLVKTGTQHYSLGQDIAKECMTQIASRAAEVYKRLEQEGDNFLVHPDCYRASLVRVGDLAIDLIAKDGDEV